MLRARAQRLLQALPIAQELYGPGFGIPEEELLSLLTVDTFVAEHGIAWRPDEDAHQHYDDEIQAYLADARNRFRLVPRILDALNMYEEDIRYLLEEE